MLRDLSQSWFFCGTFAVLTLAEASTAQNQPALAQVGPGPRSCHLLASGENVPEGFGAAYDLFSTDKELLLNVICGSSSNATLSVGNGQSTTYIYRVGYEWLDGRWKPIEFGGQNLVANDWYVGNASADLSRSQTQLAQDNFVVAYICQWINNAWKCGCRDQTCSTNYWQLQAFKQSVPSDESGVVADDSKWPRLCFASSGEKMVSVSNASQLSNALLSAEPGYRIIVAGGTYGDTFTLSRSGTASEPIVVQAKAGETPVFTGTVRVSGNFNVITGMKFDRGHAEITGSSNRITRNVFTNIDDHAAVRILGSSSGDRNRVDHNDFSRVVRGVTSQGIALNISLSGDQIEMGEYNRFDHNYFHDASGAYENGHEGIAVGTGGGAFYNSSTLIDNNLFESWDIDGEAIGIKSSDVFVLGNTLIDSRSYFSSRNGRNHEYWNNYFKDAIGIVIHGDLHRVIGNRFVNADIKVRAGEVYQPDDPNPTTKVDGAFIGVHSAARDILVAGNVGSSGELIIVGHAPQAAAWCCDMRAKGTVVEGNSMGFVKNFETGTVEKSRTSITAGSARKLSVADVGTDAPDPYCLQ